MQTLERPKQNPADSGTASLPKARTQRLIRNLLWAPVAILGAVLAVEAVFQFAHIGEEEFMKVDPSLGYSHLDGKFITFRSEGYSQDTINSSGHRDSEHAIAKPAGVTRIAVMGDSRTEAFQVPLPETFGKLLETKLNAEGKRNVEVLNFGMSGYSTGQEYLLYLQKVRQYKPDAVVVFYNVLDSDENERPFGNPNPTPRPYFSLTPENKLVVDWNVLRDWLKTERVRVYESCDWLRRNSRIWGVLAGLESQLQGDKTVRKTSEFVTRMVGRSVSNAINKLPAPPAPAMPPLAAIDPLASEANPVNVPPTRPITALDPESRGFQLLVQAHDRRLPITEAILHRFAKACEQDGTKFAVTILPAPNNAFFYFREIERIEQLAKKDNFGFINFHQTFPAVGPMQPTPYQYHKTHFSKKGHQLAAETLQDQLIGQKVIK